MTEPARRALITGITGQDGSYLAELLLNWGYEVDGLIRRSSSFNTERIDHGAHEVSRRGPLGWVQTGWADAPCHRREDGFRFHWFPRNDSVSRRLENDNRAVPGSL